MRVLLKLVTRLLIYVFEKWLIVFWCFVLSGCSHLSNNCSDGWRVTGYYTPVEAKISTDKEIVKIVSDEWRKFDKAFVQSVKIEGWGKTRHGWYLGYYGGKWHRADFPKNAYGNPLKVGQVAMDLSQAERLSRVSIPALEEVLKQGVFIVTDVGSQIKGKKVDVYTGEGDTARQLSYRITGNHTVCLAKRVGKIPVIDISP